MIRLVIIALALATPTFAQSPTDAMSRVWDTFQTTCRTALFEQDRFIAETPNPGPAGVTTVASSADGQILEARRFDDNQMVTLRVTGLPGMRVNFCSAHDQGFNAAQINPTLAGDAGPWVAAFEQIVRPSSPSPIVGGQLPIGFVARGMGGELIAQNNPLSYHYSSLFVWNDESVLVSMNVAPYSLVFTAQRTEQAQ